MEELLSKLLASELLTDETRAELKEAFENHLKQVEDDARKDIEVQVRAELIEKYHADFEKLVEAVDTKTEDILRRELEELNEDIEKFRDLEVETAEKLVEARHEMASNVKEDMAQLIETLDTFLESRLEVEFVELKESIDEVKKINFGKKLFEAYAQEFQTEFFNDNAIKTELESVKSSVAASTAELTEAKKELTEMRRAKKMTDLLESLSGRPKEVMEAILKNTPMDKLDETYATFIPRVLHEATRVNDVSEKESADKAPVLAEDVAPKDSKEGLVLVQGDSQELVTENVKPVETNPAIVRLQKLAGMHE